MSGKLDKSLDELLVNRRGSARRRGTARRANARAAAGGGIKKNKAAKAPAKAAQTATAPPTDSKIMVSGMVSYF